MRTYKSIEVITGIHLKVVDGRYRIGQGMVAVQA